MTTSALRSADQIASEHRPRTIRRWFLAIALAAAFHAAIGAWVLIDRHETDDEDDVSGSAMPIDITMATSAQDDIVAPKIGAPTPQVEAQQASTAKQSDVPPVDEKIDLSEQKSPEKSEVELPKPNPENKPETPKDETPQPEAAASAAQEAAAPPAVEAPVQERSTSLSTGYSPAKSMAKETWAKLLGAHLKRFMDYPNQARVENVTGVVVLEVSIDAAGRLLSLRIQKSSGSPLLDTEALAMMTRAQPLPPPPPPEHVGEPLMYSIPIQFKLR